MCPDIYTDLSFDLTLTFRATIMLNKSGETAGLNEDIAWGPQNFQKCTFMTLAVTLTFI